MFEEIQKNNKKPSPQKKTKKDINREKKVDKKTKPKSHGSFWAGLFSKKSKKNDLVEDLTPEFNGLSNKVTPKPQERKQDFSPNLANFRNNVDRAVSPVHDSPSPLPPLSKPTQKEKNTEPLGKGSKSPSLEIENKTLQDTAKPHNKTNNSKDTPVKESTGSMNYKKNLDQKQQDTSNKKKDNRLDFDVDLLPKRRKVLKTSKAIAIYITVFAIAVTAVVAPYLHYRWRNNGFVSQVESMEDQIKVINQKVLEEKSKMDQYGSLAYKIQYLEGLFAGHVSWSEFFPTLEKHTSSDVYFTAISVDGNNISLKGMAKDLRTAGEQFIVFGENEDYKNVELISLSLSPTEEEGEEEINVDLSFNFSVSDHIIYTYASEEKNKK